MNNNLTRIKEKECMSFGNQKNSRDSILSVVNLQGQSLGWLICIYLQVKKLNVSLIKYSDKKFMGAMHPKLNHNPNFSLHSTTHNNYKKFITSGKQSKIMINFKTIRINLPKKICNKLLSIWVTKKETTSC